MINRVFIILEQQANFKGLPEPDDYMHYAILTDPLSAASLEEAYALIDRSDHQELALALEVDSPLTPTAMRSIGAFLFLPFYLRLGKKPVIIVKGEPGTADSLSAYLSARGFGEFLIFAVPETAIHRSGASLLEDYHRLLESNPCYGRILYYAPEAIGELTTVFTRLRQKDIDFQARSPQWYDLIRATIRQQEDFQKLHAKYLATEAELAHHRQYLEVLRSGHAAREIQDYYTREYEILPLWYKRFGHLLKVLSGKRTFSSLYRDDTKKYKV